MRVLRRITRRNLLRQHEHLRYRTQNSCLAPLGQLVTSMICAAAPPGSSPPSWSRGACAPHCTADTANSSECALTTWRTRRAHSCGEVTSVADSALATAMRCSIACVTRGRRGTAVARVTGRARNTVAITRIRWCQSLELIVRASGHRHARITTVHRGEAQAANARAAGAVAGRTTLCRHAITNIACLPRGARCTARRRE